MRARLLTLSLMLIASAPFATYAQDFPAQTPLDEYVQKPDPSYRWKVIGRQEQDGIRVVVIDMVSQTWRTKADVDRPEWQHWLVIAIPKQVRFDTGMLFISGGSNGRQPPAHADGRVAAIAKATNSVVAELKMVPNQPLVFHNDGKRRTEDDLVAYTWDQYLKTGDPTWPARNPMVKAAVRAMDTISAFTEQESGVPRVEHFVVAGGSKRGWTTWITGAVDKRVVAIIPIVIDVVNVHANTQHHFAAYGFWAPSVGDYVVHGITMRFNHPRMKDLLELVDPWYYRHRLTMPKLMLNAAGDQFFPPDSSQFYFQELQGEKFLRYVPNADHSLDNTDAVETMIAWYGLILHKKPFPKFEWEKTPDGTLVVTPQDKPREVRLWQATNPHARDFRLESLGAKYTSQVLSPTDNGKYVARVAAPRQGWTAYFVELTYDVGLPVPLKLTTSVYVTPDRLPFAGKNGNLPPTVTIVASPQSAAAVKQLEQAIDGGRFAEFGSNIRAYEQHASDKSYADFVYVNWKPKGDFEQAAKAIAAWLEEHGFKIVGLRLESGALESVPPHLP